MIAPLACGVTSIVDSEDFDAQRWYRILEREAITVWYTAPTAIRMLMKAGRELLANHDFQALRFLGSVGDPLNPEAVMWGAENLGLPFHDNWWQTETGAIMVGELPEHGSAAGVDGAAGAGCGRGNCAGPLEDGGVDFVDAPGEVGELALKPGWPSMFRGYLNNEERYRKCFRGGGNSAISRSEMRTATTGSSAVPTT